MQLVPSQIQLSERVYLCQLINIGKFILSQIQVFQLFQLGDGSKVLNGIEPQVKTPQIGQGLHSGNVIQVGDAAIVLDLIIISQPQYLQVGTLHSADVDRFQRGNAIVI